MSVGNKKIDEHLIYCTTTIEIIYVGF